ncbi:EAL domain-containing protein [Microbacterium ureisolvens]|uniref:EAL domain-containing protein n=1 Tax=Microbacterium ureisolvens TaxID=2781186 RepID=A0ABS7I177_9MICO|nr:EAL domain-containing protein [Microbacterium ureisolvens]MBW9111426.1 EAL domain-containing protein [Microbacterium ureisolvens]
MRSEISRALTHALDRSEIAAWFQPQIDLLSNRVVAVEALCRWNHPEWGLVGPNVFIPVAEEDGMIGEIGRYMATQAIAVMAKWGIDVSVNVSPAQLQDSAFATWLGRLVQRISHPARRLTLEITEGRHIGNVSAVVARLDRLRAMGLGIAIDDFGAGQASLTQLKRLHATELKIDRALVVDESPTAERTMGTAITVAHDAGIRVVAEGIETPQQLEKVKTMGCDRGQGYLFARPMPPGQIDALLTAP